MEWGRLTVVVFLDPSHEDWIRFVALEQREELQEDVQRRLEGRDVCSCWDFEEVQCDFAHEVQSVCGQGD